MFDSWIHRFAGTTLTPPFLVIPIVLGFLLALIVGPLVDADGGDALTAPCGSAPIGDVQPIEGRQR